MMDAQNGLPCRTSAGGLVLSVRLTPGSSRDAVEGAGLYGDTPILKARVRAVPDKGKANAALEKLIADWLDVPASSVSLVSGNTSRLKSVRIAGDGAALEKTLRTKLRESA